MVGAATLKARDAVSVLTQFDQSCPWGGVGWVGLGWVEFINFSIFTGLGRMLNFIKKISADASMIPSIPHTNIIQSVAVSNVDYKSSN